MNILYCTYFDLTKHSPGLNRINKLRSSLTPYNINLIVVGSGLESSSTDFFQITQFDNFKVVLYNKEKYKSFGISKYGKDLKAANKFYNSSINKLTNLLDLKGIIIYSPFYLIVKTILKKNSNKLFIFADCGELFNISKHYLINGVNFQQFLFVNFLLPKLSGIIAQTPMWYKKARKSKINKVYIPGIVDINQLYRKNIGNVNSKINITFLGTLRKRELPTVIFRALSLCLKKDLSFNFKIIGNQQNKESCKWIKKLKSYDNLNEHTSLLGFISEKEKHETLSNSDIFIMLRPDSSETKHLFPSRVPELMSSGNPVVLTKTPSFDFFFKENHGVKFISDKNSAEDLSKAIMELASDAKVRFEIGKKGRAYSKRFFSYEYIGLRLSNFLLKNLN